MGAPGTHSKGRELSRTARGTQTEGPKAGDAPAVKNVMQKRSTTLELQVAEGRSGDGGQPTPESPGDTMGAAPPLSDIFGGPDPRSYLHRLWRATLQPASLLTLAEVIEALPCPESGARTWLCEHVAPTGMVAGVHVYEWGRVLEALSNERPPTVAPGSSPGAQIDATPDAWLSTAEAAARLGIARCTLDQMIGQAPRTLPGAPTPVGTGLHRRHWRWDARRLEEWLTAYRAWSAARSNETELLAAEARPSKRTRQLRKPCSAPTGRRRSLLSVVAADQPGTKRSVA